MQEFEFQCWLARTASLTPHQRQIAMPALQENVADSTMIPILESTRCPRQCPHCQSSNAVKRGFADGLQRYRCKACGKTYNALTGTPLSGLRHKNQWLSYAAELIEGASIRKIAKRMPICQSTVFRWRHRFLQIPSSTQAQWFTGITEADETYFLESFKGQRNLLRPPRKRGGKALKRGLSPEQIPVLITRDRGGATANAIFPSPSSKVNIQNVLTQKFDPDAILCTDSSKAFKAFAEEEGLCHRMVNTSAGIRVVDQVFHIQNVNSYGSNLKDWMIRFKGVATKYLHSYLGWFRMKDRIGQLLNPQRCLVEVMAGGF